MTDYPPPPPPPQQPYPQQPPPARQGSGCGRALLIALAAVGALVILAIVLLVIAVGSSDDDDDRADTGTPGVETESGNTENPPQDDVMIDACEASPGLNWATAKGTITNHSSETSIYFIEVNVEDAAGTIVGNGLASVANVPAGATATFEAPSSVELQAGMTCKLAEVNRVAS